MTKTTWVVTYINMSGTRVRPSYNSLQEAINRLLSAAQVDEGATISAEKMTLLGRDLAGNEVWAS